MGELFMFMAGGGAADTRGAVTRPVLHGGKLCSIGPPALLPFYIPPLSHHHLTRPVSSRVKDEKWSFGSDASGRLSSGSD